MKPALYTVVLLRLKTRAELGDDEDDGEHGKKYEEQLTEADVSTLSRAQRRARARQIMKQQRRAVQPTQQEQGPADGDGNQQLVAVADPIGAAAAGEDGSNHPVLTRKERQRLAKAAEREERKVLEDERKQQQELAQKEAQQRKVERLKAQAKEQEEARKRQQEEQRVMEQTNQKKWETFLINSKTGVQLSVAKWLERCRENRVLSLDELAEEFAVSTKLVKDRITQLVKERRIAGVFTPMNEFVIFYESELEELANKIKKEGCTSVGDVASWMNEKVGPCPVAEH